MERVAKIQDTVPEPCVVGGMRLKPFCLGHHLLFRRLGFPFAEDPIAKAERAAQLIPAVAICGGDSYEWTLNCFMNGTWPKEVAKWTKRLKFLEAEEQLFRAYLTDGYSMPPTMKHPSSGDGSIALTMHWELMLKIKLMRNGFDESAVLNGYLPGRWYDYYAIKEFDQFDVIQNMSIAGVKNADKEWRRTFYTAEYDAMLHPNRQ